MSLHPARLDPSCWLIQAGAVMGRLGWSQKQPPWGLCRDPGPSPCCLHLCFLTYNRRGWSRAEQPMGCP